MMTPYLEGFTRARATDIAREAEHRLIVEQIPGRRTDADRRISIRKLSFTRHTAKDQSRRRRRRAA